jgi:hypothetical protein
LTGLGKSPACDAADGPKYCRSGTPVVPALGSVLAAGSIAATAAGFLPRDRVCWVHGRRVVLRPLRVTVMAGSCTVILPPAGMYVRKITYPSPGGPEGLAGGFWSIIGMTLRECSCVAVTLGRRRTVNAIRLPTRPERHGFLDPRFAVIW